VPIVEGLYFSFDFEGYLYWLAIIFFQSLKYIISCPVDFKFSAEKSTIILIGLPLYVT
jgi:hypothetical protein